MKDHEKRNLVTDLCATAVQFHAAEQLRARIARLVLAALERAEIQAAANERERIAAHFDERDRGPDGKPLGLGFYDPHEPAEIIRALGPNAIS